MSTQRRSPDTDQAFFQDGYNACHALLAEAQGRIKTLEAAIRMAMVELSWDDNEKATVILFEALSPDNKPKEDA